MSIIGTEPTNTENTATLADAKAAHLLYLEESGDAKRAHEAATAAYEAEQDRRHREYAGVVERLSPKDGWTFQEYLSAADHMQGATDAIRKASKTMSDATAWAANRFSPDELQELTRIIAKGMPAQ